MSPFFLIIFLSLLWSQSGVFSHSLSLILVFCLSFFLINSLSPLWVQSCVVSRSLSLAFELWILFSH